MFGSNTMIATKTNSIATKEQCLMFTPVPDAASHHRIKCAAPARPSNSNSPDSATLAHSNGPIGLTFFPCSVVIFYGDTIPP